jgi:chromosome segregation ATPase
MPEPAIRITSSVLQRPVPLPPVADNSIDAIEDMTQVMDQQADAAIAQPSTGVTTTPQTSSMNPIRLISSALSSGLLSVQRDNNREMKRILQSIDQCEQHVRNQGDYIKRIEDVAKATSSSINIQDRQINLLNTSSSDHSKSLRSLERSINELLSLAKKADTALVNQANAINSLETQLRAFENRALVEEEEETVPVQEPSLNPHVQEPETPSLFRSRKQPSTPYPRGRTQQA